MLKVLVVLESLGPCDLRIALITLELSFGKDFMQVGVWPHKKVLLITL
jgi:hypothetical protein